MTNASSVARRAVLSGVIAVSSACSMDTKAFADRFTSAEERAFAQGILELGTSNDLDSIMRFVGPIVDGPGVRERLGAVVGVLAKNPPDSLSLVGVNVNSMNGARTVNLTWEYAADSSWFAVNVAAVHRAGRAPELAGFNLARLEGSLLAQSAFTLRGRSLQHYAWLLMALSGLAELEHRHTGLQPPLRHALLGRLRKGGTGRALDRVLRLPDRRDPGVREVAPVACTPGERPSPRVH